MAYNYSDFISLGSSDTSLVSKGTSIATSLVSKGCSGLIYSVKLEASEASDV